MKLSQPNADVCVPAAAYAPDMALRQVTHLCVAAHQDDIEIMAYAGITECLDTPGKAFGGVVVTDGSGSPRSGAYRDCNDEQMQQVRRAEQRRAAAIGRYSIQIQLAHPSSHVKCPGHPGLKSDLAAIFSGCTPEMLYLHNPADKHDTHVGVFLRCLEALRSLPPERQPARVLGCEVWRDLDWLVDTDKVALDSGRHPELAADLLRAFESQVAGGKRYDLATLGRRSAHATYHASHETDRLLGITWAIDLTPLVRNPALSVEEFTDGFVRRLGDDIAQRLRRLD